MENKKEKDFLLKKEDALVKVKLDVEHTDNGIKYPEQTTIEVDELTAKWIEDKGIGKKV